MLSLFSKQINKAIDECKSSAVMAKKFVGNIETKKWTLKKKNKVRAYQVTTDDDDEYVSWGSDFDESCSDDGTDGLGSRTNENCDNVNDDYDINCEDDDDVDDDDGLTRRCGSYTLTGQTDCRSSHQIRTLEVDGNTLGGRNSNIIQRSSAIYDNTYEAISETPSTSSYGGSSENSSSCFYETPPERRRGSCPSDTDKSSSGIGGMNGSTRSNSGDDRSDLSSLHFDGYSLDEKKRNSHDHDSDLNHYRDSHNHHHHGHHNNNNLHHQLSVEVTKEYIMRELNRKKHALLNGCEASSESSSGQCSEPSPKPRIRPLVKPAIPPKPNIAHLNNQSKPGSPGTRRKIRKKIVRPIGEPPPPPVPKSPPPISPASSKLSLTDRLAELTLDDLNEVLGVQLSSEPEDNGIGDEGDGTVSKLSATTNNFKNDNLTSKCINEKDKQQLESISNHNLTGSQNHNQEQEPDKMGLINSKKTKSTKQSETKNGKVDKTDNTIHDNQSSSLGINEINDIVNGIMDHDDEDFGDYETPLNFKDPIAQQINHLRSDIPVLSSVNKINSTGNSGHHHQCPTGSPIVSPTNGSNSRSPSGCNRIHSRSSSVASGSFPPPELGFSDCTGISPYPISPPPPFDDNFCCSCRKLMKSVGSTPNLIAIRSSNSSSRSELSLSQVTSSTPLSSSISSTTSMRNQSNQLTSTQAFDNNSHNSSSSNQHQHNHQQPNQHHHLHSHSTSNLSLLTVDRPKLPRSKPDCGHSNTNNGNSNNKSCNSNNNLTTNNNNNTSTGTSLKAEIAAKFAEKAAYAKKIINSRPPFRPFESIYATGKSFGFSSSSSNNHHSTKSSSSISASSLNIASNNHQNINRSGSTSSLAQRPLPPLPDDVMPIEKYSWFHGLERDSAAAVLEHLGTDGSYLVRPSKRAGQSNPLTLSILHHGKIFHLNIRRRSDGLFCLGKEKDKERTFASVPALIRFHQKEPILLTTKGESAGITKLMVTPISFSSTNNPSLSSS